MTESKIELTERLRREGRWAEASRFKDVALKEFRAHRMKRAEAGEAAWEAMAKAFPPLPPAEQLPEPPPAAMAPGNSDSSTSEGTAGEPPAEPRAAAIPWTDLPSSADFEDEVRWVHQQYVLIVEETSRGRVVRWGSATEKPPSTGACSLALWAANNWTGFYKDLLPKILKAEEPQDDQQVRQERRSIVEIEGILDRMQEAIDQELAADVPGAVQQRVRGVLSDWGRRFGLAIPGDAQAILVAQMGCLIQDCMGAVGPAPGAG